MRSAWLDLRLRIALAWRALLIDLSNFHLLQYRRVAGFLISGKNSGTHWLRFMLSHAIAARYGLPPPVHSSGRESEDFVGHPRWPRKHPQIPFIGSSHNLPSIAFTWPWLRWLIDLPPIVVLVREPKEAMLSHFVKWRDPLDLSLHDYIHNSSTKRKQLADAWWYIDFFNRWGRMARSAGGQVLVVRYEDLQRAPALWLQRISDHVGLGLDAASIRAGMAVSSRDAVRTTLDPAYGETIVPDAGERAEICLSPADDDALTAQLDAYLESDFGYGYLPAPRATGEPVCGGGMMWAKVAFPLAVGYAAFNQIGRPYLNLNLAAPWSWLELTTAFLLVTLLGLQSFPRMKAALPALALLAGGAIELAQYSRLAPGVGSFSDFSAEIAGIAVAWGTMMLLGILFPRRAARGFSSAASSSADPAAAARPERRP